MGMWTWDLMNASSRPLVRLRALRDPTDCYPLPPDKNIPKSRILSKLLCTILLYCSSTVGKPGYLNREKLKRVEAERETAKAREGERERNR